MLSLVTKKRSTALAQKNAVPRSLTGVFLALVKCDCQLVVRNSAVMLLRP